MQFPVYHSLPSDDSHPTFEPQGSASCQRSPSASHYREHASPTLRVIISTTKRTITTQQHRGATKRLARARPSWKMAFVTGLYVKSYFTEVKYYIIFWRRPSTPTPRGECH